LLLLLIVYLVVIGPLDQFWLKKIGKPMLTWITFPCYVVMFSLLIYFIGLGFCLSLMFTEATRKKQLARIVSIAGPNGLLFLPIITLIVAASVFASLTLTLYNHHWVALDPCAGRAVSAGSLTDFYTWHFFRLVPLVKFNETLKWGEPVCYSQSRVGFLILLFQALVVIPSINTIRFYWKNRG